MTVDEMIGKLQELRRKSPNGGATPLYLETPDGWCEIRDMVPNIVDDDEPAGIIETEPAAFGGDDDY